MPDDVPSRRETRAADTPRIEDLFAETDEPAGTRRKRRRAWPWVLGIVGALILVLVGAGIAGFALLGQALEVRDDLQAAKQRLGSITELVKSGDEAQFDAVASDVLVLTSRADETVQGPLWEVATWVPGVGQNIAAVRAATEATHILVRDALPPSFGVLGAVQADKIRFEGGGFNLEPLREAIAALPPIEAAFTQAQEKVTGIDRAQLLPVVDDAVGELIDVIDETAPIARTATAVLPTVLGMFGETEPRTYLVIFQNNAEIRATGGNAAASALIQASGGHIAMVGQSSSTEFSGRFGGTQYTELPAETLALYEREFATYSQNFTRTPNFPTTARLFQGVAAAAGYTIDGVVSLDPVVLTRILALTGPIDVGGIEINADNAVRVLLSETYERFPGDQAPADAFFAATSAAVFDKLVTGGWDPLQMIEVFTQAAAEQRVYAWFVREPEEQVAHELGIDGTMAADSAETTEVGIFLNDHGVGKLEYYLSTSVKVTCDLAAGTTTTALTMTNSVPSGDLSPYTLSLRNPSFGMPRTTMLIDVLYFAPAGATIVGSDPGEGDVPQLGRTSVEDGRNATSMAIGVPMGESRTVAYTSTIPEGAGPLSVRYTPTVTSTPVEIDTSCGDLANPGR